MEMITLKTTDTTADTENYSNYNYNNNNTKTIKDDSNLYLVLVNCYQLLTFMSRVS